MDIVTELQNECTFSTKKRRVSESSADSRDHTMESHEIDVLKEVSATEMEAENKFEFIDIWLHFSDVEKRIYEQLKKKLSTIPNEKETEKRLLLVDFCKFAVHPGIITNFNNSIIVQEIGGLQFDSVKLKWIISCIAQKLKEPAKKIVIYSEYKTFLFIIRDRIQSLYQSNSSPHEDFDCSSLIVDLSPLDPMSRIVDDALYNFKTKKNCRILLLLKNNEKKRDLTGLANYFIICEAVQKYSDLLNNLNIHGKQNVTVFRPLIKESIEEIMENNCKKENLKTENL